VIGANVMQTVHVRWLDGDRAILYFEFDSDFTVADYMLAVEYAWQLTEDRAPERLYVLADVSQLHWLPAKFITTIFNVYQKPAPAYVGKTMVIGASQAIRFIARSFENLLPGNQFVFVDSMDEALALVEEDITV
jgi:hypothetical protein